MQKRNHQRVKIFRRKTPIFYRKIPGLKTGFKTKKKKVEKSCIENRLLFFGVTLAQTHARCSADRLIDDANAADHLWPSFTSCKPARCMEHVHKRRLNRGSRATFRHFRFALSPGVALDGLEPLHCPLQTLQPNSLCSRRAGVIGDMNSIQLSILSTKSHRRS